MDSRKNMNKVYKIRNKANGKYLSGWSENNIGRFYSKKGNAVSSLKALKRRWNFKEKFLDYEIVEFEINELCTFSSVYYLE